MTEEQKQALIARCNYLIGGAPEIDVQLAEFALAALNQPASAALKLPDGWKWVPVEPTEDMLVNGFESKPDERFSEPKVWAEYDAMSGCQQAAHRALLCWQAMLLAAPDAPHTAPIEPICATGGAEWVKEAERLAEMHGISFVVFRHGEQPKCTDPTKVVISFTDNCLGYENAAPEVE